MQTSEARCAWQEAGEAGAERAQRGGLTESPAPSGPVALGKDVGFYSEREGKPLEGLEVSPDKICFVL